jgi:hypothetical protein
MAARIFADGRHLYVEANETHPSGMAMTAREDIKSDPSSGVAAARAELLNLVVDLHFSRVEEALALLKRLP